MSFDLQAIMERNKDKIYDSEDSNLLISRLLSECIVEDVLSKTCEVKITWNKDDIEHTKNRIRHCLGINGPHKKGF